MKQDTIPLVDLTRQHVLLLDELTTVIRKIITDSAFIGGKYVTEFEEAFADYCGTHYCIGVANGTDALMISLLSLGVGPGDEVITTACSFFATAEAISRIGAKPVFCDIDPQTANINVHQIENRVTPSTKAIVPVHLYGQPAEMTHIMDVAQKHSLFVVEDCAQAVGARYDDRRVGGFGDIGCFSFYPSKNLGGLGDCGAIVTNNSDLAAKCRVLANHGGSKKYEHQVVGFNSRLDAIQAAALSIKLPYLDEWNAQRQVVAGLYRKLLRDNRLGHIDTIGGVEHVNHLYVVRVEARNDMLTELRQRGIGVDIHYPDALPFVEAYQGTGYSPDDYPAACRHSSTALSLPIFPLMRETEVERVAENVMESLEKNNVIDFHR